MERGGRRVDGSSVDRCDPLNAVFQSRDLIVLLLHKIPLSSFCLPTLALLESHDSVSPS